RDSGRFPPIPEPRRMLWLRFGTTFALSTIVGILKSRRVALNLLETRLKHKKRDTPMLSWALTFLGVALIAGVFGFGVVAGTAAQIAQVLFFLFLVLFVVSLIFGRTRTPVV